MKITDEDRLNTALSFFICELDALEHKEGLQAYKATYKEFRKTLDSASWTTVRKAIKYRPVFRTVEQEKQHLNNCIKRTLAELKRLKKWNEAKNDYRAALGITTPVT